MLLKEWKEYVVSELISEILSGISLNAEDVPANAMESGILKLSCVQGGIFKPDQNKRISPEDSAGLKVFVEADTILITRANTPELVGLTAYVDRDHQNLYLPDLIWMLKGKNKNLVDMRWLNYYFSSPEGRQKIKSIAAGSSQSMVKISKASFQTLSVLLPPLPEQKKIAEILGSWDTAIEQLETLIEKKQLLKRGLMQKLLSGKVRFPEFEGEWNITEFLNIVEVYFDYRGKTPLKLGMEWGGGSIRALSANNVKMGKIDFNKECYYASESLYNKWMTSGDTKMGDVIFTMEAPLGNVAQIPDNKKYLLSQRVILIRPKVFLSSNYLAHYMRSDSFQDELLKNSSGSTAKGIQRKQLDKLTIRYPELEEQIRISNFLGLLDNEVSCLQQQLEALKTQKLGLMQQLLTGKRRV